MKLVQTKIKTSVGNLYLLASEKGLRGVNLESWSAETVSNLESKTPEIKILKQAKAELEEYFSGKRKNFEIPLDIEGSAFQKKVWNQLQKIPYGKTCAYKDIATKLRDPNASRAVGTANGKNPLWIVVPCHRVITASGTLGGYAGGLDMKTKLLQLESNINE